MREEINYKRNEKKEYLKKNSIEIKSKNDLERVATISANNDSKIGKMIADIVYKVGVDGTVNVQNGKTLEHEVEITDGIRFNRGYVSNYFVNNQKMQRCEFNTLFFLCYYFPVYHLHYNSDH